MTTAMTVVDVETSMPKKKQEKIAWIETQPQEDWFVPAKTKRGKKVWYLRFKMTGRNDRLYGPFKSKQQCLLFLDDAIDEIDKVQIEVNDAATKRMIDEPCARVWMPIIDYPV